METIEIIRLSEKQKQQLIVLKRKTSIENWNVLCRWALCMSLSVPRPLPREEVPSDSNVEMTWKTFAGEYSEIYLSVLKQAYKNDVDDPSQIDMLGYLKLHINRGISLIQKKGLPLTQE
jgi:DNA sulfur modification protein DndE